MKTIVAATDFSKVSINAVYYAAEMARYLKKNLSILHVCELPPVATEIPVPAYDIVPILEAAERDIKVIQEEITNKITNCPTIFTEVRIGSVTSQLKDYCDTIPVYAVVMGINGNSEGTSRFLFGSKTLEALNQLKSPLIVVPAGVAFSAIERVGLASDFVNVSRTIPFYEIKDLVKELHADLHILHIKQKKGPGCNDEMSDEFRVFRDLMRDLNPAYHIIHRDNIEAGIDELVKMLDIDLLLVVPGKHTGLEKIFHKSHTRQLTLAAQVPILSIHE